jgi:hypothetical protein
LILDHELWVRIAANYPIHHVDAYWAVERTHEDAKTIAQAENFVDEAFAFIEELRTKPVFAGVFEDHHQKIRSGLHVFSARRLIDSGKPKAALRHFKYAWHIEPESVLSVWYKWLQALGGAIGLQGVFLKYREIRRKLQHKRKKLVVQDNNIYWE